MQPEHTLHLPITSLPPELFIGFCYFLPPVDLFTLSQVCRKFRGYLFAPNSLSTQQIWKESRLQFMPGKFTPPVGIREEKYVELLMTERGCQICKCNEECEIYFEFEVRCCKKCFLKRIVASEMVTDKYPREFLNVMPYAHYDDKKYYWIVQIDFAYSQYCGLSKKELQSWLFRKKFISDEKMTFVIMLKVCRITEEMHERIEEVNHSIDRMSENMDSLEWKLERLRTRERYRIQQYIICNSNTFV